MRIRSIFNINILFFLLITGFVYLSMPFINRLERGYDNWLMRKNINNTFEAPINLVYFDERSGKETAELLGLSIANVKVRTFRARNKLKKVLNKIMEG